MRRAETPPRPNDDALAGHLQSALTSVLSGAELVNTALPENPDLLLLLLGDTQAGRDLDPDTAQRVMDDPLYWVFCWASGRVLANYLLTHPELVHGKRVLDFGCGSGVVAIASAMAGAVETIACDLDPLALEATTVNARLNEVTLTLSEDFDSVSGHLDVILAADVLYDRANLHWLERFLTRADEVWIADSRIRDFEQPDFQRIEQLASTTLPDLDESQEFNRVALYRGRRPRD